MRIPALALMLRYPQYSAMDDEKKKASSSSLSSSGEGGERLGVMRGFDLDLIVSRRPGLTNEISGPFRDHLLQALDEDEEGAVQVSDCSEGSTG